MIELVLNSIALQINEAVETVHQNEDECRKIALCVGINSAILQKLEEGTDVTKDNVMREALEDVKTNFEDALKLVKKCQSRHIFCRFFLAKDMTNDLKLLRIDIGDKMQQATFCGTVHGAVVATKLHCNVTSAPPSTPRIPVPREDRDIEGKESRLATRA
jgi:hypothetical protein